MNMFRHIPIHIGICHFWSPTPYWHPYKGIFLDFQPIKMDFFSKTNLRFYFSIFYCCNCTFASPHWLRFFIFWVIFGIRFWNWCWLLLARNIIFRIWNIFWNVFFWISGIILKNNSNFESLKETPGSLDWI